MILDLREVWVWLRGGEWKSGTLISPGWEGRDALSCSGPLEEVAMMFTRHEKGRGACEDRIITRRRGSECVGESK